LVGSIASTDSSPAPDSTAASSSDTSTTTDPGTSSDSSSTNTGSSDATSTDSGASSTSASADVAGRYIVTFADGVTEAEQAAAIADAGATDISAIAPLRMHCVDASGGSVATLAANCDV